MMSLLLLLLTSFTLASPPSAAVVSEHRRLQQEIARLAERHIWVGVERTWIELLENGGEPSDDDCVHAAHAAMTAGDLATARERWMRVARRTERRDVIDALKAASSPAATATSSAWPSKERVDQAAPTAVANAPPNDATSASAAGIPDPAAAVKTMLCGLSSRNRRR